MSLYRWLLIVSMLLSLMACKKAGGNPGAAPKIAANAVFVDTAGLAQNVDVANAVLAEIKKDPEIKLVSDRKEANIYLGLNGIVPEEVNAATKTNFIVLSYVLVNFDNKFATEGLGMGQRDVLDPFISNVISVLKSFIKDPQHAQKKK